MSTQKHVKRTKHHMNTRYTVQVKVPDRGWCKTMFIFKTMTEASLFALSSMKQYTTRVIAV